MSPANSHPAGASALIGAAVDKQLRDKVVGVGLERRERESYFENATIEVFRKARADLSPTQLKIVEDAIRAGYKLGGSDLYDNIAVIGGRAEQEHRKARKGSRGRL